MGDTGNDLKRAYDAISDANVIAYRDLFLISNQVLCKNPFRSKFLDHFLARDPAREILLSVLCKKMSVYYLRSFKYYFLYLLNFVAFAVSPLRFETSVRGRELYIIDTFFLCDRISKTGHYDDPYMPGIAETLKSINREHVFLPLFYGNISVWNMYKVFKILHGNKVPVITEFQLLSVTDLLYILYFILAYPFHVLRFTRRLGSGTYEDGLLKTELKDTIDQMTFNAFTRYCQGRRIAKLPYDSINVISWFENQTVHKNLYKGLRTGKNVKIYGAQLLLYSKAGLNLIVDENERDFGVVPDTIVVNGPYYMPEMTPLHYVVGPSLRYARLFSLTGDNAIRDNILVILSYYNDDTENILNLLAAIDSSREKIVIKAHPATPIDRFQHLLPSESIVSEKDIYDLFRTAKIVIGSASGSLLEAACTGIPVISVRNAGRFDYNVLPEYGRGIIWEEISDGSGLNYWLERFGCMLQEENAEIKKIASAYMKMFFCNPTRDEIIRAFDLVKA